jgi:hypothetical protein
MFSRAHLLTLRKMTRKRIRLRLVSVISLLVSARMPAGECPKCDELPGIVYRIHRANWQTIQPNDIDRLIGIVTRRRDANYPKDSPYYSPCSGSLYLLGGDPKTFELNFEFDRSNGSAGCEERLTSVALEVHSVNASAEALRAAISDAVRAGGRPTGSLEQTEYLWRNVDSRTRFQLTMSVTARSKKRTPQTPAVLKVVLTHDPVQPSDVDDLPYERGFMCQQGPSR